MKKFTVIAASLVLALSFAACGSTADSTVTSEPAESVPASSAASEERPMNIPGGVQIANPYVTLETAEEMQEAAGLEVSLPTQLPEWVTETIYRAMPDELIEVIYKNEENEIRVRIAEGNEDISGVYGGEYAVSKEVPVGENTVAVNGNMDGDVLMVTAASWITAERTYSVTSTAGVAEADLLALIAEIQ